MSLLLLFNNRLANASLSTTENDDGLSAAIGVVISPLVSTTEAGDSITSTSTVLASPSVSLTEADDAVSATAAALVSAPANITEDDDAISASALSGGSSVSASNSGAGGYIRRVRDARSKPKQPERLSVVAVVEQGDAMSAAATVDNSQILAARRRRRR